jgi:hypothetical protein
MKSVIHQSTLHLSFEDKVLRRPVEPAVLKRTSAKMRQ